MDNVLLPFKKEAPLPSITFRLLPRGCFRSSSPCNLSAREVTPAGYTAWWEDLVRLV